MPPEDPVNQEDLEAEQIAQESISGGDSGPPVSEAEPETPPVEETPEAETPPPAAESEPPSFREIAGQAGFDLSQFPDDTAAAKALAEQAATAKQYAARLSQYEQYIAAQQAAQPQPEPDKEKPLEERFWDAPNYDPAWFSQVRQDEKGELIAAPGADGSAVDKLKQWATFQQSQQDKFWQNPFKFLDPYIEARAKEITESTLGQYEGSVSEKQKARDLISQNASWMVAEDDKGQKMLTEEGQIYNGAIREVGDLSTDRQHQFAMQAVELHRAKRNAVSQQATEAHEKNKAAAVSPAQKQPSAGGTVQPGEPQSSSLTLQQMLERDLKAAGITDADLAANY